MLSLSQPFLLFVSPNISPVLPLPRPRLSRAVHIPPVIPLIFFCFSSSRASLIFSASFTAISALCRFRLRLSRSFSSPELSASASELRLELRLLFFSGQFLNRFFRIFCFSANRNVLIFEYISIKGTPRMLPFFSNVVFIFFF